MDKVYRWGLLIILSAIFWQWWKTSDPDFPPIRRGIPVLGVIPFTGNHLTKTIGMWSFEDGHPVLAVRIGSSEKVYLNTYEAIYKGFVEKGDAISGRPINKLFCQTFGDNGVTTRDYSEFLKDQKELIVKQIVKFQNKDNGIEVREQAKYLIEHLRMKAGNPIDLDDIFARVTVNLTTKLLFGKGFDFNEHTLNTLLVPTLQNEFGFVDSEFSLLAALSVFHDTISSISPFHQANQRFIERQELLLDTIQTMVEQHKKSFDKSNIRDLTDALIFDQQYGKWKNDPRYSEKHVKVLLKGIYTASFNLVKLTLQWNILALLHFPEHRALIVKEIDEIIGSDLPSYNHRESMPFTRAFQQEVYRHYYVITSPPAHQTIEDVDLMGYHIPKHTEVIENIWAAHHDPNVWKNPDKFDPYRHLDEKMKFVSRKEVIPFSLGTRKCAGPTLAEMEIFLHIANILQSFDIKIASNQMPSLEDEIVTVFNAPPDFKVILQER